ALHAPRVAPGLLEDEIDVAGRQHHPRDVDEAARGRSVAVRAAVAVDHQRHLAGVEQLGTTRELALFDERAAPDVALAAPEARALAVERGVDVDGQLPLPAVGHPLHT